MSTVAAVTTMDSTSRRAATGRWGPIAGLGFVVFFIASVVASSPPASTAPDRDWITSYTGTSNQVSHLATGILLALAGLSLLCFLTALWQRIAGAGAPVRANPLPLVAAAVSAACIATGGTVMGAISGSELMGSHPLPRADVLRLSNDLGFGLVGLAGMLGAALSIAVLSRQGRATGVLGRKTSILGMVTAVALLGGLAFLPILVLLVWLIVVSVSWLRSPVTD